MLRRFVGICLYDIPVILLPALKSSNMESGQLPWTELHNKDERLILNINGKGVQCDWQGGSDLYLPTILPSCGRWLYRRALRDFPVIFKQKMNDLGKKKPEVSFIIGHRGIARLPLLLTTLQSIAGQNNKNIECIVVEQDKRKRIKNLIPGWIRYIHSPLKNENIPFSRGIALNVGARAANSDLLILHDGDMLVPSAYVSEIIEKSKKGYDFINLKRFIFYLNRNSNELIIKNRTTNIHADFDAIVQNLVGGASLAISRSSYFKIGGFDERFVGWGFEDLEFMHRARTLNQYPYDYLPFIHLWHEAQEGKWTSKAPGLKVFKKIAKLPVSERIEHLRSVNRF